MTAQSAYTCVAPLRAGAVLPLRDLLKDATFQAEARHALDKLPGIHFARMLVIDAGRDAHGHYLPPAFVLSSWHDGEREDHLQALTRPPSDWLDAIIQHCHTGGRAPNTPEGRREFLRRHAATALMDFNVAPGRTVDELRKEITLVPALRDRLATREASDPVALLEELREQARADPTLHWMFQPFPSALPDRAEQRRRWRRWLLRTGPAWLTLFATLHRIRRDERAVNATVPDNQLTPPPPQVAGDGTQNPYTFINIVKPGPERRRALRLLLDLSNTIGGMRTDLSSITTIRFAHFTELNEGRRLLFASVYDGSWDAYMSDFISLAGWAITGIWSNTVGFPPTDYLLLNGARHERAFRTFVRKHEVETTFWYRAYPGVSNDHISGTAKLREALTEPATPQDLAQCLSLF